MKKCTMCGKRFEVLWPEIWAYKRGLGTNTSYFCSWECLRKYDKGREQDIMLKDEQKRTAAEMALEGKNPLPYLKQCGMSNPTSAWQTVRKWAEKNWDPDVFEDLPEKCGDMKETAEARETVELVYDPEIAEEYRREQEQKKANEEARAEELIKSLPPVNVGTEAPDESEVWHTAAIRNNEWGTFYFDDKYRTIDWRHPGGEEISLPLADWKRLPELIPQILHVLGAEVKR